VMVT